MPLDEAAAARDAAAGDRATASRHRAAGGRSVRQRRTRRRQRCRRCGGRRISPRPRASQRASTGTCAWESPHRPTRRSDSALYAWAAAPGSPIDIVGFSLFPSPYVGGGIQSDTRTADRWMRATPPTQRALDLRDRRLSARVRRAQSGKRGVGSAGVGHRSRGDQRRDRLRGGRLRPSARASRTERPIASRDAACDLGGGATARVRKIGGSTPVTPSAARDDSVFTAVVAAAPRAAATLSVRTGRG